MIDEQKIPEMLRKVRSIRLQTRRVMDNTLAGSYHSIFKGQGLNFEEIREYTPGDEVRFIDWNASSKLGRPFIKTFREERELTLILALDVSGSMQTGCVQQSKREFETEVASLLAFSALKNNDKVGLFLFSDSVEKFVPPQKGQQQLLRIIREVLFFQPQRSQTNLLTSLTQLNQMIKKRAIVCLISDFMHTSYSNELMKTLSQTNQHHDLICIRIQDPRELDLPDVGFIALKDAETQQEIYLDTSRKAFRDLFAKQQQEHSKTFENLCRRYGIDMLTLTNGSPYDMIIKTFFKKRQLKR